MSSFVHPVVTTFNDADIVGAKIYPLIRELSYKYGLVVVGRTQAHFEDRERDKYVLSREDGFPICEVHMHNGEFCIRNIMEHKERGRTTEDKLTYYGTKVPSLMKNIAKHKLIPASFLHVLNKHSNMVKETTLRVAKSLGAVYKSTNGVSGEKLHDLLKIAFDNQNVHNLSRESIDFYKDLLDKYRAVDETRDSRKQVFADIYDKPVKFIYYDILGSFIVGEMKINVTLDADFDPFGVTVTSVTATRKRTFMDDPEIAPRMAMLKVHLQQNHGDSSRFTGDEGFFPDHEGYNTELNISVQHHGWRHEELLCAPQWVFLL